MCVLASGQGALLEGECQDCVNMEGSRRLQDAYILCVYSVEGPGLSIEEGGVGGGMEKNRRQAKRSDPWR